MIGTDDSEPRSTSSLPTFVVIGAMKTGTSSLHGYLGAHPDVFMAEPKELDFFVEGKNWERGVGWYRNRFAAGRGATARGEISPSYSKAEVFPGVPERMVSVVPGVRIVYVVRDPLQRMISMYHHEVAAGREERPIGRALLEEPHYVLSSSYAWQLRQYEPHIPRERILVIRSEDLRTQRPVALDRIFRFIGVAEVADRLDLVGEQGRTAERRSVPRWVRRLRRTAVASWLVDHAPARARGAVGSVARRRVRDEQLTERDAAELRRRLAPDVEALAAWMGPEFDGWGYRRPNASGAASLADRTPPVAGDR